MTINRICEHCGITFAYDVPAHETADFADVEQSGEHVAVCYSCDPFGLTDSLAHFRPQGQNQGQPSC